LILPSGIERVDAQKLLEQVAGGQYVAGVASEGEALALAFDLGAEEPKP
jgi:hypothetical protein